jgi:hypothetical protein
MYYLYRQKNGNVTKETYLSIHENMTFQALENLSPLPFLLLLSILELNLTLTLLFPLAQENWIPCYQVWGGGTKPQRGLLHRG